MFPLRNLYRLFLALLIHSNKDAKQLPYNFFVSVASVMFMIVVVLFGPLIIFKKINHFISPKDIEDVLEARQRLLAIYRETSEYQYRSSHEIHKRLVDKNLQVHGSDETPSKEKGELKIVDVFCTLLLGENVLFTLRLENRNEYVERRMCTQVSRGTIPDTCMREMYEKEFADIVTASGDSFMKGFYLGREILALKINTGKRKRFNAPNTIREPSTV